MIFCEGCKHFGHRISNIYKHHLFTCHHPLNTKQKHDWQEEWDVEIRHPRRINKHNNCKWHEPKEKK